MEENIQILGLYVLCNQEKYKRVVDGVVGDKGQMIGGIGRDAPEEQIIAEYDRLGGLIKTITTDEKIETGTFWDFQKRKPKENIEIRIEKKPEGGTRINTKQVDDTILEKKVAVVKRKMK